MLQGNTLKIWNFRAGRHLSDHPVHLSGFIGSEKEGEQEERVNPRRQNLCSIKPSTKQAVLIMARNGRDHAAVTILHSFHFVSQHGVTPVLSSSKLMIRILKRKQHPTAQQQKYQRT